MQTMKLEIDGKMQDVQVFASMWEYISHYGSDITITHYRKQIAKDGEKIVLPFRPIDDVEFSTYSSEQVEIDGVCYQRVFWGESGISLIPERGLTATLWAIYEWDDCMYAATGEIFPTEEQAVAAMEREVA